jgi:hypothetical protein
VNEFINRDKAGLDIFWLHDKRLEESDNLPDPDVLAQKMSKTSKPPSYGEIALSKSFDWIIKRPGNAESQIYGI